MTLKQTYQLGKRKGLPKWCECGGRMLYSFGFGVVWSCCAKCTPVVRMKIPRRPQP